MNKHSYSTAFEAFQAGAIIAYPTEAVFGLGCDPDNTKAIDALLAVKQRPIDKGLILLAGKFEQLIPYIDVSKLSAEQLTTIKSRWPNGITQVMPAKEGISRHLSGQFDTIAVRVTSQADVVALCEQTNKPIVSTSCNLTGHPPALTWQQAEQALGTQVDFVIKGQTMGFDKPSTIIDALTGDVFRT
ncbi:L-threonylcarbamoyladenylate synthase [Thalassotalea aquiviva]|uniref:L-threonylcarbamoyladenylate synthase n=1 Tax=Thalassotalea aquiviva TaxID=3242415 RepID=UPI00352B8023